MCIQVFTHGDCPEQKKIMKILDEYGILYAPVNMGRSLNKKITVPVSDDDLLDMILSGIL